MNRIFLFYFLDEEEEEDETDGLEEKRDRAVTGATGTGSSNLARWALSINQAKLYVRWKMAWH
jgi:hypothetical protein